MKLAKPLTIIMVMSKHCTGYNHCDKLSDEYKNGRVTTCDATFSGSSGAMEPQALFKRSLDYNIRYIHQMVTVKHYHFCIKRCLMDQTPMTRYKNLTV